MPKALAVVLVLSVLSLLVSAAWIAPQTPRPAQGQGAPLSDVLRPLAGKKVWWASGRFGRCRGFFRLVSLLPEAKEFLELIYEHEELRLG